MITRRHALLSLALLFAVLLSHAKALPLPAIPVLPLALASRLLPSTRWAAVGRLLLLAASLTFCGLTYGWLDSATLRSNLLLVLALKWAEARGVRELQLLVCATLVGGAIGILHWGDGIGIVLILLETLLALAIFEALQGAETPLPGLARAGGRALLRALPLATVLFVFFPRIPGPLWDIGLSFGLPLSLAVEQSNQGLGVSTRLKPGQGQTQTGVRENQPVLVAEFANWVPPTGLMYWRGPVYYDFDGQEWLLDAEYEGQGRNLMARGWKSAAAFSASLKRKAQEIRYRIRLSPHGRLWLYGLDLPARLTTESFVGPDWQVLSHTPVDHEISYELASWLDWEAGDALPAEQRRRALALPPDGNPELRSLGARLAAENRDANAIVRAALTPLNRDGYKLRDRFQIPEGPHALDTFWFRGREGNAELYAGTFVFLMRAAGVPARLVTGYRGGKLMALTDYVVVKRSHAHAWVEVWDTAKGWRRIDPADLIAPERFAGAAAAPKPAPQAAAKPTPENARPVADNAPAPGGKTGIAAPTRTVRPEAWQMPDLGAWIVRWIFRLDGETQKSLLGGQGGGFAWAWLLAAAVCGASLLLGGGLFLARLRELRHLPAAQRAWRRACRRLAQHGLAPLPSECPSDFARRIAAAQPAWARAVTELAGAYADWRYGPAPHLAAPRVAAAARHLANRMAASSRSGPQSAANHLRRTST